MIPIHKDFDDIPTIIFHKPRLKAFRQNKIAKKYCSSDSLYKPKAVKKTLDNIYHRKCAYCEKCLKDADRHVEHYRPKIPYYWLVFSWDNLLLACKRCNELKSNQFTKLLEGEPIEYNNETLETAQSKIKLYDFIEKPLIINPEQETETSLKAHFTFDLQTAEIKPNTERMRKTIEVCGLNREELIEKRIHELNRLRNHLEQDLFMWKDDNKKENRWKAMCSTIEKFKQEISPEASFIAWRNFILQNWKTIISTLPIN